MERAAARAGCFRARDTGGGKDHVARATRRCCLFQYRTWAQGRALSLLPAVRLAGCPGLCPPDAALPCVLGTLIQDQPWAGQGHRCREGPCPLSLERTGGHKASNAGLMHR